jgi:DNA-binding PadR family transcriptional regulator
VRTRALRNPLSLVVLGLLAEQPLHPYGMRVLMRERGHDRIVKARSASLYDAVARLTTAGLVEVQQSTRAGRRPERTVYRITNEGKAALQAWVRDGLADLDSPARFIAALSFMFALPKDEVLGLLIRRATALSELIDAVERGLHDAVGSGVQEIFLTEERYSQALRVAERDWLVEFTDQLQGGTLVWPAAPATPTDKATAATAG